MNENNKNSSQSADTVVRVFQAMVVVVLALLLVGFVYSNVKNEDAKFPFKLGLDLAGGSHLIYEADVSKIDSADVPDLMNVLRDVIERRVNVFGVSEPIVQVEHSSIVSSEPKERLVVELPGVSDVEQAVAEIGKTPLLEFKLVNQEALSALESIDNLQANASGSATISNVRMNGEEVTEDDAYIDTGLTGRYLSSAALEFAGGNGGQLANEPIVSIAFNSEGGNLFAEITKNNIGENLAIFLDGELISAPRINESIVGGRAIISGGFTPEEARSLAQNLNFGALPVPIELFSTQTIGASLGDSVLDKGVKAGAVGILIVMAFMWLWYRVPGIVASMALVFYIALMLSLFMVIPVTLTAAGLAGFILSIGMAVDANVLVFERMKEELARGNGTREAARIGFARAWSAIRDGNITSILSAIILFWFGTSIVKGFALVFGLGVIVSMLTALTLTRTLLIALPDKPAKSTMGKLFNSGIK